MGDVDQLQNAEEFIAQREEEAAQAAREELLAELHGEPAKNTGALPREEITIALSAVKTIPNIRAELTEIEQLAASIHEIGLLQLPVVTEVADSEGEYLLVAGRRRLDALRLLAADPDQPARFQLVRGIDEAQIYEIMLTENAQRVELPPIQVARALRRLLELNEGTSAAEMARGLGYKPDWAQRYLRMLALPESVQERLESGDLSFTAADMLRRAQQDGTISSEEAEELAEQAANSDISTKELGKIVGRYDPTIQPEGYEQWASEDARRRWEAKQGQKNDAYSERDPDADGLGSDDYSASGSGRSSSGSPSSSPAPAPVVEPGLMDSDLEPELEAADAGDEADPGELAAELGTGALYNVLIAGKDYRVSESTLEGYLYGRLVAIAPEALLSELGLDGDSAQSRIERIAAEGGIDELRTLAAELLRFDQDPPAFVLAAAEPEED